jgi:GNAT superfamily N-acetyltransferase
MWFFNKAEADFEQMGSQTKLIMRPVEIADLADLAQIEGEGVAEPASLADLRRWHDRALCPISGRGKRLWTVFLLAARQRMLGGGDTLGHVVLRGENGQASVRIVVHPRHRGRGVGRRLLDAAIDEGRDRYGLALVEWIVHERHESTLAFARSRGFKAREVEPVVPNYFGPHCDGFVLRLPVAHIYG